MRLRAGAVLSWSNLEYTRPIPLLHRWYDACVLRGHSTNALRDNTIASICHGLVYQIPRYSHGASSRSIEVVLRVVLQNLDLPAAVFDLNWYQRWCSLSATICLPSILVTTMARLQGVLTQSHLDNSSPWSIQHQSQRWSLRTATISNVLTNDARSNHTMTFDTRMRTPWWTRLRSSSLT